MIIHQEDINSLARSEQRDSIATVNSVSIPSVPRWGNQVNFPNATHEVGAYETGSGLAGLDGGAACVLALLAASAGVAMIGWYLWGPK